MAMVADKGRDGDGRYVTLMLPTGDTKYYLDKDDHYALIDADTVIEYNISAGDLVLDDANPTPVLAGEITRVSSNRITVELPNGSETSYPIASDAFFYDNTGDAELLEGYRDVGAGDYVFLYQVTGEDVAVNVIEVVEEDAFYAAVTPYADNSGITDQEKGEDGSKEVTLTITVQNTFDDGLEGYEATDFSVKVENGDAVDLTSDEVQNDSNDKVGEFSDFTEAGDGVYTVVFTGEDHDTSYTFTELTVDEVEIEASEDVETPDEDD